MIVTIDGPAGAGKSSAARALARRLDFEFLDTGAMFRAVTLVGLGQRIDFRSPDNLDSWLHGLKLEMPAGRVVVNGEDVTALIRTPEVTVASGAVADHPAVRRYLAEQQRSIAAGRNMVCEGRDQGTIVFPAALCKFFLVADPKERARRRWQELQARGDRSSLEDVLRSQNERDQRDAGRGIAPMVAAEDAIVLDSTGLTHDEVVSRMEQEVHRRVAK